MTATASAASIANAIHVAITGVIFGHPTSAARCAASDVMSIEHVHALTQRFALAAPMGGGAILAIHALNRPSRVGRSLCD